MYLVCMIIIHYYILQLLLGGNYSCCLMEHMEAEEIVCMHS